MEVEIGRGKKARRAYGFDDIAIVPSRRTRDPDDVHLTQGTVVSAEHVSQDETRPPLNLKEFIGQVPVPIVVGGCASYHTGLHLMRTGAAGVLVGVGPGAACTMRGVLGVGVPQATV